MVDRAIDIVDRFHESILKMEREVLIHPKMHSIRDCARFHLPFNPATLNPVLFSALALLGPYATTARA